MTGSEPQLALPATAVTQRPDIPNTLDLKIFAIVCGALAIIALAPLPEILRVSAIALILVLTGGRSPGVGFFMVGALTIVDGALRKWFLPGVSAYVYLCKDLVLVICYFGAWRQGWWKVTTRTTNLLLLRITWALLVVVVFLDIASFRTGDLYIVLNGARMYLLYLPLAWVLPNYIVRFGSQALRRGLLMITLLVIPMAVLATVQFRSPRGATINKYVGDTTDIASFGDEEGIRATGTFSYISGLADFVNFFGALAIGLAIAGFAPISAPMALTCVIWCGICSGSRSTIVWLIAQFLVTMMLSLRQMQPRRAIRIAGVLILAMYGMAVVGGRVGNIDALAQRAESSGDTQARIEGALLRPIASFGIGTFFGQGLGTSYQQLAARETVQTSALSSFGEVTDDRFMTEIGYPGLLVELIWRFSSVAACWYCYRRTRDFRSRSLVAALLVYQCLFLWSYPLYDAVASIYYSASLGVSLALYLTDSMAWQSARESPRGATSAIATGSAG